MVGRQLLLGVMIYFMSQCQVGISAQFPTNDVKNLDSLLAFHIDNRKCMDASNEVIEAIRRLETEKEGHWHPNRLFLASITSENKKGYQVYIYSIDFRLNHAYVLSGTVAGSTFHPGVNDWVKKLAELKSNTISINQAKTLLGVIQQYKFFPSIPKSPEEPIDSFVDTPVMYLAIHEKDRILNFRLTYNKKEDRNLLTKITEICLKFTQPNH